MTKNFWQQLKKPILALAPMAGITDSAFRELCRNLGADVVYSEMISADGLYFGSQKTLAMLKCSQSEKPLVIQLFGKDPVKFANAAKIVEKAGASGIDINFGCPAKKVVRHSGGVTLMRDLNLCHEIVKSTLDNTNLPISVKLRTSISTRIGKRVTIIDFLKKIADLPVSAIMIHGRSYEQGFSGEIDYKIIKQAKKYFSGIVLANGGVTSPETALNILNKTQADGLGIARGIYGQPWLFRQIKDYLTRHKYAEPIWSEKKKIILKHAKLIIKDKTNRGLVEMRKHLLWYIKGFPQAKILRQELVQVTNIKDIKTALDKITNSDD